MTETVQTRMEAATAETAQIRRAPRTSQSTKDIVRAALLKGRRLKQHRGDGFTAAVEELLTEGVIFATEYDADGVRTVKWNHQPTD